MLMAMLVQGVAEQAVETVVVAQTKIKREKRMRFLMDKIKFMTKEQGEVRQREIEQGVEDCFYAEGKIISALKAQHILATDIKCPLCNLNQKHQVFRNEDDGFVKFRAICDHCGHIIKRQMRPTPTIKMEFDRAT